MVRLGSGSHDDVTFPAFWTICRREGKEVRRRVRSQGMMSMPWVV
jgi:hypothetical protein